VSEWKNKLYFGDNLEIMREYIPDESVDLIYLDPPFKSNATYNILFEEKNGSKSRAQIKAFEDSWHWCIESEKEYLELVETGPKGIADLMQSMRGFLGANDMMAYLVMMAIRLLEMKRILKETGSIYLHCDPTASHYLKLVMDAIFGGINYRNEIAWCYTGREHPKTSFFPTRHQIIFYYVKDVNSNFTFNKLFREYDKEYVELYFNHKDKAGRLYQLQPDGKGGRYRQYLDETEGIRIPDWWEIKPLHGKDYYTMQKEAEYLGYPTQKPEALLTRIIKASSNEGHIILDPFCGCGTTITVAEELKRKWIGIDITYLAVSLMRYRLERAFKEMLSPYEVIGDPKDLKSAEALAKGDRSEFERWAVGMIKAMPYKPKGADSGIDGYIYFHDDTSGKAKEVIIQVKSGHVGSSQIRDLKGVLEREKAQIGGFITLQEPTREMIKEAATAGFYECKVQNKQYPKIQILTIEDLFNGKTLEYPRLRETTFKQAERKTKEGNPGELF